MCDYRDSIDKCLEDYKKICDSSFIKISFSQFCLNQLKQLLSDLGLKYETKVNCSQEFLKEFEEYFYVKMKELNELEISNNDKKNIQKLANIYNWLQDYNVYKGMDVYKNSFCERFFETLKKQIELSKNYKDKIYRKKLKDILEIFDKYFIKKEGVLKSNTKKKFNEKREELEKKFKENFDNFSLNEPFDEARTEINAEINNYKTKLKDMLKEGKQAEEIINKISSILNEIIKKLSIILKNRIRHFNNKVVDLANDIKNFSSIFNQLQLEKNEQFKNNFIQLINAGKDIFIQKNIEDKNSYNIINGLKSFFNLFKGKEEIIIDKIETLKVDILDDLNRNQKTVNINILDSKKKIKGNLNAIFLLFEDLCEKDWIESKELYKKVKSFFSSYEKMENLIYKDNYDKI